MIHPQHLILGLEQTYSTIQTERMCGMPFLNSVLRAQAVGFQRWGEHCLGVMITPWFMNVMLLPCEGDGWTDLPPGTTVQHRFPSGVYEFVVGEESGIGRYQSCSLFSPMEMFEDQTAAVATAEAALAALMASENREISDRPQTTQTSQEENDLNSGQVKAQNASNMVQPAAGRRGITRRDLLRGVFRGEA